MKLYLWPLSFRCQDCQTKLDITEILAAADGDFHISGKCPKCIDPKTKKQTLFVFKTNWTRMEKYCKDCDTSVAEGPKPLRPPLALPQGLTQDDKKFLKDFHIAEGDSIGT